MSDSDNISVKIVILGEPAVGKTTLRINYIGKNMNEDFLMTLGADLSQSTITISDKITLDTQIWDIAGQENFAPIIGEYLKGAQGAILVYDMTRSYTFDKIPNWLDKLHNANPELDHNIPFIIVGNKADLDNFYDYDEEKVEEFVDYVNRHHVYSKTPVEHLNTSAKTGYAVQEAFKRLGRVIVQNFVEMGEEIQGAAELFGGEEPEPEPVLEHEQPEIQEEEQEEERLVRPSELLRRRQLEEEKKQQAEDQKVNPPAYIPTYQQTESETKSQVPDEEHSSPEPESPSSLTTPSVSSMTQQEAIERENPSPSASLSADKVTSGISQFEDTTDPEPLDSQSPISSEQDAEYISSPESEKEIIQSTELSDQEDDTISKETSMSAEDRIETGAVSTEKEGEASSTASTSEHEEEIDDGPSMFEMIAQTMDEGTDDDEEQSLSDGSTDRQSSKIIEEENIGSDQELVSTEVKSPDMGSPGTSRAPESGLETVSTKLKDEESLSVEDLRNQLSPMAESENVENKNQTDNDDPQETSESPSMSDKDNQDDQDENSLVAESKSEN